jgi:hypothetical protein
MQDGSVVVGAGSMRATIALVSFGLWSMAAGPAAAGTVLITSDEAKLPPPKGAVAVATRGITRGPRIEFAGGDKGPLTSPARLQVKFQSFGGASIDLNSLQVTYLRATPVDITARVKPFAQPGGIDIPDAELPPGEHNLKIDLRDSDGRPATANVVLTVKP